MVSSSARERLAFASLCESHHWGCAECDSLRALRKLLRDTHLQIVLTAHRLADGYSDDVISTLLEDEASAEAKIVVILPPGTPPSVEARQVKLGADCVLRDPVRNEVLVEYLLKYRRHSAGDAPTAGRSPAQKILRFAGGEVLLVDRQWRKGSRSTRLTPREIELIDVLLQSEGRAVSYPNLFSEILGRRFRGDTSNLRVLLGLLDRSAKRIGISLRDSVEVIRKLGYRYRDPDGSARNRTRKSRRARS